MSNSLSKGTASSPAPPEVSAPSMRTVLQSVATTLFWWPATRRNSGRFPRASSVTRVLGAKSSGPIWTSKSDLARVGGTADFGSRREPGD